MEKITTVGIDLAKRVFALHAVDASGRVVLRKTVRREQLLELVARLAPCRTWGHGEFNFKARHCGLVDDLVGCSIAEALARPIIERVNDEGKLMIGYLLERHMRIEDTGRLQRKHV